MNTTVKINDKTAFGFGSDHQQRPVGRNEANFSHMRQDLLRIREILQSSEQVLLRAGPVLEKSHEDLLRRYVDRILRWNHRLYPTLAP